MKKIIIAISSVLVFGLILSIILIKNYNERIKREYIEEEQRVKQKVEFEENIRKHREKRYSEYLVESDIAREYFEKNMTSIELEKRKGIVINDMPGKIFKLYIKVLDIKQEDSHRIVSIMPTSVLSETEFKMIEPSGF